MRQAPKLTLPRTLSGATLQRQMVANVVRLITKKPAAPYPLIPVPW